MEARTTGWLVARAFERPLEKARFAHTSPIYVQVGRERGLVPDDAKYFLSWIDREVEFYKGLADFRSESDREAMLGLFRKARTVYERLAMSPRGQRPALPKARKTGTR